MSHKLNAAGTVAVANECFWEPMSSCPIGCKVQLLGAGGVSVYGDYIRGNSFWQGWAPIPRRRPISPQGTL